MAKINENTKMVDFPDVKLEKGETSTPVLENTAPQETHANMPTVKDVKEIAGGKGGHGGGGDIEADNIFANDELEIGPSAGLGTNLREKVTPTRQVIANAGGLVVPTTAPTDETLVGVGTGREQIQIYLGDGLELVGDTSPYHIRVKNTPTEIPASLRNPTTRRGATDDEIEWINKHGLDNAFTRNSGPVYRPIYYDSDGLSTKLVILNGYLLDDGTWNVFDQYTYEFDFEDETVAITLTSY